MKRSPLRRSEGFSSSATKAYRPKTCKACREKFVPVKDMQAVCMPPKPCAQVHAENLRAKAKRQKQTDDKRETREKLERLRRISDLEADCRKIIQKIARIRDRRDGCISCHMGPNYDGVWHGSHYRAHGGCSSLQFNLWNVHKACAQCNLFKGGNREGYVRGLLLKPGYGRERLEWLDSQPKSQRFERDYLMRFKVVMAKRLRRIEKRAAT